MTAPRTARALNRLATLVNPVRRRLYDHVTAQPDPVGRDAAAAAVGISRRLAAFHLDKLADEGLLTTSYRRLTGRSGPGAGRPAKLYARAEHELSVTIPPRDYELAARLFAAALTDLGHEGLRAATEAARRLGRQLAAASGPNSPGNGLDRVRAALTGIGYQPYDAVDSDDGHVVRLRNCPFHRIADEDRQLTCTTNLAMLSGMLDEIAPHTTARLEPTPGQCCVTLRG
ncbi:helix-turn-helix transcriptional regulator [Geodermatophilus sp. URMC 64]